MNYYVFVISQKGILHLEDYFLQNGSFLSDVEFKNTYLVSGLVSGQLTTVLKSSGKECEVCFFLLLSISVLSFFNSRNNL